MRLDINLHLDYGLSRPCDLLLQIEAAAIPGQHILAAQLDLSPCQHFARVPAQDHVGTRIWLRKEGQLRAHYHAEVLIEREGADLARLPAAPPHRLPGETVQYLLPSRYCPSHQFTDFADERFGHLEGGARLIAIRDWVAGHVAYTPGSSNAETTAVDTFHGGKGVCRDYAHLLITLARAGEIPARFAAVYAPRVTPPDFHAVVEVFLGGEWHLVDATGMARPDEMAVIGIGRDSGDVAFLTAFGPLFFNSQSVFVEAIAPEAQAA